MARRAVRGSRPGLARTRSGTLTHPEHRPAIYTQSQAATAGSLAISRDDLLAAKALLVLQPAIRTQGIVADDSGNPIPGADVRLTDADQSSVLQSFTSDAKGRFPFITKESGEVNFMSRAKGFATKFQSVFIQPDTKTFTLGLSKATPFKGRVADQNGQPVAGALVRLDRWSGGSSLQWQTNTDDEGRFTWDSPPEGTITFYITATNYSTTRMSFSGSFGEHTFNLRKMSRVFGRVLDAETRKPVEDFTVIRGHAYNPGESMRWQRYNLSRGGRNGEYSMRLDDYSQGRNQILIEAPGYLPAVSPALTAVGFYTNDFELKKGKGIAGIVQWPDGTPVPNATIVLVDSSDSAYMDRPGELRRSGSGGDFQRSDLRGRFEFAPKLEAHTLIAAHAKGYAEVHASNVLAGGALILQPWGRVTGVVRVGPRIQPGRTVSLQSYSSDYGQPGRQSPALSLYLRAEPDADGHFVFEKVPAGDRVVHVQYKLNDRESGRTANSHGLPLLVMPGATNTLTLGGTGRTIVGRVTVKGGDADDVDWRRDAQTFSTRMPSAPDIAPPVFPTGLLANLMSNESRQKIWEEYYARQRAYWQTDKGIAILRAQRHYAPLFETNGAFHIDNVPPGEYTLNLHVTNPDRGENYYEQIGSTSKEITVPPPPPGKPDEPFDLGAVELPIRGTLRVGKRAPPFETTTFAGKRLKLDDCKGRYVLLDFWATWSGVRTFDLQILKALQDTYAKDDRFVMIGLNFDHQRQSAEEAIRSDALKWTQCYVGPWGETTVASSYGIQGLPAAILIGPDGKIAGYNMRGSMIRTTVRNVLGPPRNAPTK